MLHQSKAHHHLSWPTTTTGMTIMIASAVLLTIMTIPTPAASFAVKTPPSTCDSSNNAPVTAFAAGIGRRGHHHHSMIATSTALSSSSSSSSSNENSFAKIFTGGAFDKQEKEAARIASGIRSVKDLGWTSPAAKRRGSTRPRHRAFGGSDELPVQSKPNYDESKDNCVERWLTLEEFHSLVKNSGPAADTVFVALAGGGAFAEREVCEARIEEWRSSETTTTNGKKRTTTAFDEGAFLRSVRRGRTELALGWILFFSATLGSASCIVLPTNPLAKGLEGAVDLIRGNMGV